MPVRDILSLIFSSSLIAALSVSSWAQAVYGSVFGTITDPHGARVWHGEVRGWTANKQGTDMSETLSAIVELRFFGGLTIEETAEVLGVSHTTVEGDWSIARAWLRREMSR